MPGKENRRQGWGGLARRSSSEGGVTAENRHGGAPKGERAFRCPSATDAPRLTRAAHSRRKARRRWRRCASRRSAHPSTRWVKMKLTRARRRAGTS